MQLRRDLSPNRLPAGGSTPQRDAIDHAGPMVDHRRVRRGLMAAVTGAVVSIPLLVGATSVSAQERQPTTTLPTDNRSFGDIIPAPNSGNPPSSPGDPGGWMQVMMFFLICGAVLVLIGAVWYTSRRARDRRRAAGLDPVDVARRQGRGVRPVRPGSDASTAAAAASGRNRPAASPDSGDSAQNPQ